MNISNDRETDSNTVLSKVDEFFQFYSTYAIDLTVLMIISAMKNF